MTSDEYEAAMAAFMGLICTLAESGTVRAETIIDGLERSVQTLQGDTPSGAAVLLEDFVQQVAPALAFAGLRSTSAAQ